MYNIIYKYIYMYIIHKLHEKYSYIHHKALIFCSHFFQATPMASRKSPGTLGEYPASHVGFTGYNRNMFGNIPFSKQT